MLLVLLLGLMTFVDLPDDGLLVVVGEMASRSIWTGC